MPSSQASVATPMAEQILFKLAKHFAKKVTVRQQRELAEVDFGIGQCRISWQQPDSLLRFACEAPDAERLQRLQQVLDSHLTLMSRREPLTLAWETLT
jgi:hypothetical protein